MSTENNATDDATELDQAIVADPEIRKLPADSEEYAAAVKELGAKKPEAEKADEPAAEEGSPKRGKSGLERRFSELTTERDAERARASALEARLNAIEAERGRTPEPFTPAEFGAPKPRVDDFETYGDFQEALVDWKLEKKEHEAAERRSIAKATELQREVIGTWDAREKATRGRVEGYDELVSQDFVRDFTTVTASKEAMQLLLESECGPDLLYELAEDGEKLAAFGKLSPVRQVTYLSKMEASYEAAPAREEPRVSRAPAPPRGLPKGNGALGKELGKEFSFAEYTAWRERQPKAGF